MFNITSKYFSFFDNKPPASWAVQIPRDFLICYSCLYYSFMLKHNLYWKQVKNGKRFCWFYSVRRLTAIIVRHILLTFCLQSIYRKIWTAIFFVQCIAWGSVWLLQDYCILWDFLETVFSTKVIQSFKNFMSMFSFDPFCVNDPIFFNAFQCFLYFAANATEYRKKLIRCIKTVVLSNFQAKKLCRNSTEIPPIFHTENYSTLCSDIWEKLREMGYANWFQYYKLGLPRPISNQKQKLKNIYLKKTSYFFLKKKFIFWDGCWPSVKFFTPLTPQDGY